jgi:hypothetical protein
MKRRQFITSRRSRSRMAGFGGRRVVRHSKNRPLMSALGQKRTTRACGACDAEARFSERRDDDADHIIRRRCALRRMP